MPTQASVASTPHAACCRHVDLWARRRDPLAFSNIKSNARCTNAKTKLSYAIPILTTPAGQEYCNLHGKQCYLLDKANHLFFAPPRARGERWRHSAQACKLLLNLHPLKFVTLLLPTSSLGPRAWFPHSIRGPVPPYEGLVQLKMSPIFISCPLRVPM